MSPLPEDQYGIEPGEEGQAYGSVDKFLDHVKTIDFSKGYSLLYDAHQVEVNICDWIS